MSSTDMHIETTRFHMLPILYTMTKPMGIPKKESP